MTQAYPDLFLHIVERRPDGIVVRGAKMHQTGALNSHEIIIMPTQSMRLRTRTTRCPSPCPWTPTASL